MKNASPSPTPNSRVFKPRTPVALVVSLVAGFLLLLVVIFFAIDQLQTNFIDARMTGIIVEKNFVPAPRQEVILDTRGNMQVRQREGDYSLTVRVRERDGSTRDFTVSNVPPAMFESVEVGQRFDVGPYLLPPSATEPILPSANATPTPEAPAEAAISAAEVSATPTPETTP